LKHTGIVSEEDITINVVSSFFIYQHFKTRKIMLYYKFKNYEEFKDMFGIVKHGNGVCSRKNRILLAYIRNRRLLHEAIETNNYTLLHISSMAELKKTITRAIIISGHSDMSLRYVLELDGEFFYSRNFETDDMKGLCKDGDTRSIRYINHENGGKTFKMKAGKLYRSLILETEFGKTLPEQVVTYLCEEFSADWQTYTTGRLPKNRLCVDKNFEKIYSSSSCVGDFYSCMVDRKLHYFYTESVDASAAYLTNEKGKVTARCVIYNRVTDQDGKIWRLAERQYASNENDILKRALIDALIKGGYIDGYKKVGAGAGDTRAFVDLEENSLSDRKFRIECDLDWNDTLSYQDSFKWYNQSEGTADNYGSGDIALDITDGSLNGEEEYDDFHGYHCYETRPVYCHGCEYYCDVENLDEFIWIEKLGEYHHESDVIECLECSGYFLEEDNLYSDITKEYYCCEECRKKAEQAYKQENWHYSDYDEEYYEHTESITIYQVWNNILCEYERKTISVESAQRLLETGELHKLNDMLYDGIDEETGLPYAYEMNEINV
jgi:hypothetical protein